MISDLALLSAIVFFAIAMPPFYFRLRSRMTRQKSFEEKKEYKLYGKKKIYLISLGIFFVVIISLLIILVLFISVKTRDHGLSFDNYEIFLLFILFLTSLLIIYGAGSYTAAIIIEQCILHSRRKKTTYRALQLYNDFFHGPFSHVLMYAGGNFLMLVICVLEKNHPLVSSDSLNNIIYIFYGVILGSIYYRSQVRNLTWKHQMPSFFLIFIAHILFIYVNRLEMSLFPFNLFFLSFGISLNVELFVKFIFYRRKGLFYRYNLRFDQVIK